MKWFFCPSLFHWPPFQTSSRSRYTVGVFASSRKRRIHCSFGGRSFRASLIASWLRNSCPYGSKTHLQSDVRPESLPHSSSNTKHCLSTQSAVYSPPTITLRTRGDVWHSAILAAQL